MTESINPVTLAEETGAVYKETGDSQVYVLLQVKPDAEDNDTLDVDVSTEGLTKEQAITVLEAVLNSLKEDDSSLSDAEVTIQSL